MTAPRQIPPVRTRRVLVSQSLPEAAPAFRAQEGEFVFMPVRPAANDAHNVRKSFAQDGESDWNVPMIAVTFCLLALLSAIGAGLVVLVHAYIGDALTALLRVQHLIGYSLGAIASVVLAIGLVVRVRPAGEAA